MKRAINRLWHFKWLPLLTLLIELIILSPCYLLMIKFGEKSFAYNLDDTPLGSSQFLGLMIDSIKNDGVFQGAIISLVILMPLLFLFKIVSMAGVYSVMQQDNRHVSAFLSSIGEYCIQSILLFLRWLIVPAMVIAICFGLLALEIPWLSVVASIVLVIGWLLSLSVLNYSMIVLVRDEKRSLRKGFVMISKNLIATFVAIGLLLILLIVVNGLSYYVFKLSAQAEMDYFLTLFLSLIMALVFRFVILFWQSLHINMAERLKEYFPVV